jgi:hypothetical protein
MRTNIALITGKGYEAQLKKVNPGAFTFGRKVDYFTEHVRFEPNVNTLELIRTLDRPAFCHSSGGL